MFLWFLFYCRRSLRIIAIILASNFNSVLIICWSSMWSNLFGIETLDLWNLCWSDIWKAFSLVYNVEAASAQPAPNKCCIGGSWQKFEPELAAPVLRWPVSIAYLLFSLQMHSNNNMDTRSERDQGRFFIKAVRLSFVWCAGCKSKKRVNYGPFGKSQFNSN